MVNLDQLLSLVRAVLVIAGTFIVTSEGHKGMLSATDWQTISGALLIIVPIVWSWFVHKTPSEEKTQ